MFGSVLVSLGSLIAVSLSCGDHDCYGPINRVHHVRHVKRMQPGAPNATYGPKEPLQWGQVNFLHTVSSARRTLLCWLGRGENIMGVGCINHT